MNDTTAKISYSFLTQMKSRVSEVLVLGKLKEKPDSKKTKTDFKQKIDHQEFANSIENIKETKGELYSSIGAIQVQKKIKQKVEKGLENYDVQEAVQKNSEIIIEGLEEEYVNETDEMFLNAMERTK